MVQAAAHAAGGGSGARAGAVGDPVAVGRRPAPHDPAPGPGGRAGALRLRASPIASLQTRLPGTLCQNGALRTLRCGTVCQHVPLQTLLAGTFCQHAVLQPVVATVHARMR